MLEFNNWIDDIIKYEIKLKALFLIHIAFFISRTYWYAHLYYPHFDIFTCNILGLAIKYMIFRIKPNAAVKYK